jgi:hypothetical protein
VPLSGSIPELPHVEKVGRPFGFSAFGRFGAAEVSRLLGFAAAGLASSMQTRLLYL